ncbi:protein phosphatase 2C domain-containing protein [Actinoplanes auranticolor]|uniref:protein phosphatase 2C domain-containing protein n=1 Tax=Actinoplanes auranticolor TaxID=47988 RepID=UPI001BB3A1BB|nr:protein phosphatase 2C domain-containing protein [Actinoplanes auranticolor]
MAHAFDGTPGQDACGITWNQQRQSLIAAVADGLGSKPDSGDVAHQAVAGVLREGQRLAAGKDFAAVLEPAAGQVRRFVEKNQVSGATTLVLSEIRPTAEGAEVTVSGVGDSEAWFLHDGAWTVLHHERRSDGENVTRHLPSQAQGRARRIRVPHGSVVVLASDGFAGALGMDGSPLGRELAARWRQPPPPVEFLAQVNFEDEFFTDDRTAVAVWIR